MKSPIPDGFMKNLPNVERGVGPISTHSLKIQKIEEEGKFPIHFIKLAWL